MMKYQLVLSAIAAVVAAQASLYSQCGGQNWSGATTCVAGASCVVQNPYYSQCLPSGSGSGSGSNTLTTSVGPAPQTSSPAPASPSSGSGGIGPVLKASFTEYGAGDSFGSPNCNTATAACGFYDYPGYNAAISQNYYGVGPGAGAGPACGTCYRLTPQTDSSGNPLSGANSIVVKINNLCPAQGNPLCAQSGTSGTNQYGANVNFDTCIDDGASAALFGSSGTGLALGIAQQVDCSEWTGSSDITKRLTGSME